MSRGSNLAPILLEGAPFAPDERAVLGQILGRATGEQRAWLAGFLAGLAARDGGAPRAEPQAAPRAAEPLLILYATESGNAEGVAAKLAASARRQGFKVTLKDVADGSPAEAAAAKNLLLVAATWGEGEPPSRAAAFHKALMGEGAPRFEGVRFAVLALGDRAYANFCQTGREIDARLEALGAVRVAERVDCDLDFAKPAAAWGEQVLAALKPAEPQAGAEIIRLDFAHAAAEPEWSRDNPFAAEVQDLINLNSSRSDKATAHLALSLAGSGIAFEPGDALMLVPENDPAMVGALLEAAGVAADETLTARLRRDLDVTTLSRATLEAYQRLRPQAPIAELLAGEGWRDFIQGRQVIDLLEAFPSRLETAELVSLLRPLPARAYSIANSPLAYPDEAHLLVGRVEYESHGRRRQGVASGFVTGRLAMGATVGAYLRPNRHFRLPDAGDTPIVMVGPGTGVAPFRGFVQHRREQGHKGKSWLFFGERRFTHDFLYQLEWQELVAEGALTRMDVAFSRDQPEKVYVQHRLWERRAELWSWLQDGAVLYLCGDAAGMAKDVEATLRRIAADRGGMTDEAAAAWLDELVRERRFRKDVY